MVRRRLIDLSHVISDGLVTYPGLPAPRIDEHLTRAASHVERLTGLQQLPLDSFHFTAAPPRLAGMATWPVRAYATIPWDRAASIQRPRTASPLASL